MKNWPIFDPPTQLNGIVYISFKNETFPIQYFFLVRTHIALYPTTLLQGPLLKLCKNFPNASCATHTAFPTSGGGTLSLAQNIDIFFIILPLIIFLQLAKCFYSVIGKSRTEIKGI